jgi:hypothetical protein
VKERGDETAATAITTTVTVSQHSPKANPHLPCLNPFGVNELDFSQICFPLHLPDKF